MNALRTQLAAHLCCGSALALGVLALGLIAGQPALAAPQAGRLVKLRLPLESADDKVMQGVLQRTADKLASEAGAGRPVLILEFVAGKEHSASEFERCLSLSRFLLREMTGVKTVAYLPRSIQGHAVLIAMACEEIAMAPDAELGEAGVGEDPARPIEPGMVGVYEEIAGARRNFPTPIAVGMIDRRVEVLKVEDQTGVDFVLRRDLEELEQDRAIATSEVLSSAGSLMVLSGREAREFGFVKYLVSGEQALARVLNLPAEAVQEDQTTLANWTPAIIEINGAITPRLVKQIKTLIGTETSQRGVNWIGFRINSGGGPMEQCIELASVIAALNPDEVRTVAYVPVEASGGAALVALACDQLIMHPVAKIGGGLKVEPVEIGAGNAPAAERGKLPPPAPPAPEGRQGPWEPPRLDDSLLSRDQLAATRSTIQDSLAKSSGRGWSLLAAMIDPDLQVFQYKHRQTGETALFCEDELTDQSNPADWQQGEEITKPDVVLALDSQAAVDHAVAFQVVEGYDQLKQLYGLVEDPPVAKPNWALEFIEALANPWLAGVLLMVAFVGILVELNTPGVGVGGFVSCVAFLLFFWSHFLSGTAEWLEVLLFLMGLFFILLEIFALPGFGVFGLGGGAMVLAAIVLASQTFVIPQTQGQLGELRESITTVVMAIMGCLAAAFALRRFLPHAPGIRRMMLAPADESELAELDHRESLAEYTHLIGCTGAAITNLMPSGKADIEGELIDVIADGQVIERGENIVVISAQGNRVMVKKA